MASKASFICSILKRWEMKSDADSRPSRIHSVSAIIARFSSERVGQRWMNRLKL